MARRVKPHQGLHPSVNETRGWEILILQEYLPYMCYKCTSAYYYAVHTIAVGIKMASAEMYKFSFR